ncbi:MAG: hypothetical protein H6815_02415 [Phycisphaeraceae bacterium]|nr:hypothetical protein [Phycisphaerales bacterium]MCB9859281.1 hypothetical protein [Phycisphaeraceae bacterium]
MEELNNTTVGHESTMTRLRRSVFSMYSTDHRSNQFRVEHTTFDPTRSLPDEVYQRILSRGVVFSTDMRTQTTFVLCVILVAVFAQDVLKYFGFANISPWVHYPVLIACSVGLALIMQLVYVNLPWTRKQIDARLQHGARIVIAEGLCARCYYPLAQCPIENDVCRVCPECGCAWRDDCIHRHHELVPGQRTWKASMSSGWHASSFGLSPAIAKTGDGENHVLIHKSIKPALVSFEGDSHLAEIRWLWHNAKNEMGVKERTLLSYLGISGGLLVLGIFLSRVLQTKLGIVFSIVCIALLAAYWHWVYRRDTSKAIRDLYIKHNVCPWCAASLSRVLTRDDGTNECADCGCAIPKEQLARLLALRSDKGSQMNTAQTPA